MSKKHALAAVATRQDAPPVTKAVAHSLRGKSIADLTDRELRTAGSAAGRQAYRTAIKSGTPVAVLAGDQLKFVTNARQKPNKPV